MVYATRPQTREHRVTSATPFEPFSIRTGLTPQEQDTRRQIQAALQGNALPGKHSPDAQHLAEAAKYCGYFITHDQRILKRSGGLGSLLPPTLNVVTLAEFMRLFDDLEAGRRI